LGPDVNLKTIAQSTAGFTGADLANLLNEAALLAARANRKAIVEADIEEATIKVMMGAEKKSRVIKEKDKMITSYHEAGHAVVSYFLPTQDPVHQISIIPRGMAAGYTMYLPDQDKGHISKTKMEEDICSLLGGRAAEELTQDDICTGASNDIERATELAHNMVTKFGMSAKVGLVKLGTGNNEVFLGRDFSSSKDYSDVTAAKIDSEIKRIIDEAYKLAEDTIRAHIDKLNFVADFLVKYEVMDADQFRVAMESLCPNAEEIYAMAEEKRRISEEENQRKKELDEKDREEREKYLRENDENYDETDVNEGRFGNNDSDEDKNDGEVPH
jgi:cell division protease FtsH